MLVDCACTSFNASREADFDVVFVKLEELRASLVMTNEIGLPNSLEQVGF